MWRGLSTEPKLGDNMRYLFCILITLLLAGDSGAGHIFRGSTSGVGGPTISYYFNANSATTGQSPTVGSGTVTISSGCSAISGAVGNAVYCTGDWEQIEIPVANIISTSVGTLGMYITPSALNGYLVGINDRYATWPSFVISRNAGILSWQYASSQQTISGVSNGVRYFLEIAWDFPNAKMAYRLDGSPSGWAEISITGSQPTSTATVGFGGITGGMDAAFDQIISSTTYKEDIYAVRNNTSF